MPPSPPAEQESPVESKEELAPVPSEHEKGPPPVQPPPDGGLLAWLQVAGGFCLAFNTWGLLNTFGVYQSYYQDSFMHNESSSTVSWIG